MFKVIPRAGDNIFPLAMSIGFRDGREVILLAPCDYGSRAAELLHEDELEVDSDRCIMTYMG